MSPNASTALNSLFYQWQKLKEHENAISYLAAFGVVTLTYALYHVSLVAPDPLPTNRHSHVYR